MNVQFDELTNAEKNAEIKFTEDYFNIFKNTDADYLLICRYENNKLYYSYVPDENNWETIEEAIEWNLKHNYFEIKIYDLYSLFEKSLIRQVSKTIDIIS